MKKIQIGLILLLIAGLAFASMEGEQAGFQYFHNALCDSARVLFGYPDTSNFYFTLKLMPCYSGATSKLLYGYPVELDSIGTHSVKVLLYPADGGLTYGGGTWDHLPDLVTALDSLTLAITKTNKANFRDWTPGQKDSIGWAYRISIDSLVQVGDTLTQLVALSKNLTHRFITCDGCYQRLFPEDGSANKDSVYMINPNLSGGDTLTAKIVYRHSNVPSVYDSAYIYLNPWW